MRDANPKKKGRRLKKLLIWLCLSALAGGAVYLFVIPGLAAGAMTTYNAYEAVVGSISNALSFSGSVSVVNSETLSAGSEAIVRQIYVSEEEEVTSGQKLMRLSNGETLKAGFNGRVNEISAGVGDSVTTGTGLVQVVDFKHMKVTMRVDEYGISDVTVGQACRVTVKALDATFDSQISHINRMASSTGSTAYYTVTAELEASDQVLPGMQVTVTIPQEEAVNAVILNKNALSFDAQNSAYVWVKSEAGEMETRYVQVGVDNDNYVEIISGLAAGEKVYAKVEKKAADAGGLSGLLSALGGGATPPSNMPGGAMPQMDMNNFWGGGDRGGNNRSFGGGSTGGGPGGW